MDKITVVCHKDHVVGYEDYRDQCLLCVVEDLMREVGRLTAVCKEKEWVGLTDKEIQDLGYLSEKFDASNSEWFDRWGFARAIEQSLREKNHG